MSEQRTERFLVTGAYGCIGAWVVRQLLDEGAPVVALDMSDNAHRLRLLLTDDEFDALPHSRTDITDLAAFERALDEHEITNVIHLAALQVPFCREDPPLGARVNVVGTVNVLEAAHRRRSRLAPVVYASSIAAYEDVDAGSERSPSPDSGTPSTLYGVYKRANEGSAAVYWRDCELPTVGLRPSTVYGPGRDQGVTSTPTLAMLAAAAGETYHIPYGGRFPIQYAPDVARTFIAASRSSAGGAAVHNISGNVVKMSDIVDAIEAAVPEAAGRITYAPTPLPFPEEVDSSSLVDAIGPARDTPLHKGVAETIDRFRRLLDDGLISFTNG
ncbi:NAD-dependent epimerase/dehydratase family protein [Streptomyces sp. NPDC001393]